MLIGVLGAGQLGRMLALAGYELGARFLFLDPTPDAPAGQVAEQLVAPYDDDTALARLSTADVVTYEFESVPEGAARRLAPPVRPPPGALAIAQDRLLEKRLCQRLGIPTPRFASVESEAELAHAVGEIGLPAVLKTRRLGYDGKGQQLLRESGEVAGAWRRAGSVPAILEAFVPFDRELSILAVRTAAGDTRFYPLIENHHQAGMLRLSRAPAPHSSPALEAQAQSHARRLLEELDYVGVMALELFEQQGELLANEIAPRVHNSGHLTIEAAVTSQFENHLRAILDLPLGATALIGHAAMVNLVGTLPDRAKLLSIPDCHLHFYGKAPRQGRKVGHVTLCARDPAELDRHVDAACAVIGWSRLG